MKKVFLGILSFIMFFGVIESDSLKLPEIELSQYYGPITLLVSMHLEIGDSEISSDSFQYYTTLLTAMDQYAKLDIMKYLQTVIDVDKSLSYSLDNLSQLLSKASAAKSTLERNMEVLAQTKSDCDTSKTLTDKNFSMSLKDFNSVNMQKNLDLSKSYDRCASDARINYNVYKKIYDKIVYYYDILENKYAYFTKNQYEIVANFDGIMD